MPSLVQSTRDISRSFEVSGKSLRGTVFQATHGPSRTPVEHMSLHEAKNKLRFSQAHIRGVGRERHRGREREGDKQREGERVREREEGGEGGEEFQDVLSLKHFPNRTSARLESELPLPRGIAGLEYGQDWQKPTSFLVELSEETTVSRYHFPRGRCIPFDVHSPTLKVPDPTSKGNFRF